MFKAKGNPRKVIGDVIKTKVGVATATTGAIVSATAASPCVVTDTSHGLLDGQVIKFGTLNELTVLSGREFVITGKDTNTFKLLDENGVLVSTLGLTAETTAAATWTVLEPDEGTVTMSMNSKAVALDLGATWNIMGYTWDDVFVGGYVVAYQTDDDSDVYGTDIVWMYVSKAHWPTLFVIDGA